MKATEFAYWLQGLFELAEPTSLDAKQTDLIKRHLAMVFYHDIDRRYPQGEQAALQAIHDAKPVSTGPTGVPAQPMYNPGPTGTRGSGSFLGQIEC